MPLSLTDLIFQRLHTFLRIILDGTSHSLNYQKLGKALQHCQVVNSKSQL